MMLLQLWQAALHLTKQSATNFKKKNDPPHSVSTQVDCVTMNVVAAHCTCKVGLTGFCNHVRG